jgi:hypothetical protein
MDKAIKIILAILFFLCLANMLALLFQPFFKIALGRQIWNIVDVVVGIGLLISIFMKPKESPR